jgi:hypothetical protein
MKSVILPGFFGLIEAGLYVVCQDLRNPYRQTYKHSVFRYTGWADFPQQASHFETLTAWVKELPILRAFSDLNPIDDLTVEKDHTCAFCYFLL